MEELGFEGRKMDGRKIQLGLSLMFVTNGSEAA